MYTVHVNGGCPGIIIIIIYGRVIVGHDATLSLQVTETDV